MNNTVNYIKNEACEVCRTSYSKLIMTTSFGWPSRRTFDIYPIRKLLERYDVKNKYTIDPFANESKIAKVTNDLNPDMSTDYHLEATDFLKLFSDESVECVLYDPPYSARQVKECYEGIGLNVTAEQTKNSFYTSQKNEVARVLKPGGLFISFGWSSGGAGRSRGFEKIEILLVSHGGTRNDTIVTVERKLDLEKTIQEKVKS